MALLKQNFFKRETSKVAVDLLGQILVRDIGGVLLKGRIVETEAYLGLSDNACHSFGGRLTERTQVMYRSGGFIYVYFTYGKYYCFNIITAGAGEPEAVLIRAVEPLTGIPIMQKNRGGLKILNSLTNGPGKLCQAFGIDKTFYGLPCPASQLYVEKAPSVPSQQVLSSCRIGLSPHNPACFWPLRFYVANNPYVS